MTAFLKASHRTMSADTPPHHVPRHEAVHTPDVLGTRAELKQIRSQKEKLLLNIVQVRSAAAGRAGSRPAAAKRFGS
ncbi:Hypothetical protein SMAX5B_005601 [Scophthalmus maximus]|uniref:Uncharacterized protein n=1 Tax=Scophthalmus maximus TaxID=52904 RepID=A0A2U9BBC1_SCOMX|nr:Hypothetical protein SMAX5B_005601 [Scophthalmus maximus]